MLGRVVTEGCQVAPHTGCDPSLRTDVSRATFRLGRLPYLPFHGFAPFPSGGVTSKGTVTSPGKPMCGSLTRNMGLTSS